MAYDSLNFSPFVNQQIQLQETIHSCLAKAQALIQIAMNNTCLENFSHKVIHDFLWALSDVVNEACESSEYSLGILLSDLENSHDFL